MKCEICGKIFTPNPRAHGQKYCGYRCYQIANNKSKHAKTKSSGKPVRRINNLKHVDDYLTIPQAPKYEINSFGVVRNKDTGYILKWYASPKGFDVMTLGSGKAKTIVSKPNLLWLLHGQITYKKPLAVPCIAKKGTRYARFDTITSCSKFLAKVTHLTQSGAYFHLVRRKEQIADWQIEYFNWG